MSYIKKKLALNETIAHSTRPHGFVLIKPIIALVLFMVIVAVLEAFKFYNYIPFKGVAIQVFKYKNIAYCIIALLFFILPLIAAFITIWSTEIAITDKRVLYKKGLFTVDLQGMPLSKVENIDSTQSLFGRIFKYGDVTVKGSGSTPMNFKFIKKPHIFRTELANMLREHDTKSEN